MLNSGIRSSQCLRYLDHDLLLVRVRTNSNHTTQSQEVHCSLTHASRRRVAYRRCALLFTDSEAVGFCVHLSDHVTSLTGEVLRGALRNPNSGIHCNRDSLTTSLETLAIHPTLVLLSGTGSKTCSLPTSSGLPLISVCFGKAKKMQKQIGLRETKNSLTLMIFHLKIQPRRVMI